MRVGLRLALGLGLGLGLGWSALSVAVGLDLLELLGREDCGELLAGLLVDRLHLLFHDHRGDCGVIGECGDLAVAIGKNGFELGCLIG